MAKLARVWDRNFELLHTFEPGEDYKRLPIKHPLASTLFETPRREPVFLTVDEDESPSRWSGRLAECSVERTVSGARVMELSWVEARPVHILDPFEPSRYATPGFSPTIPGADWFVEGQRFREVAREDTEDGSIRVTLRPVSSPSAV